MRTCLTLVTATLLAGVASAQATTSNIFSQYPQSTDAVSRHGLAGGSLGDLLVEIRGASHNTGGASNYTAAYSAIGDLAGGTFGAPVGTTSGFQAFLQDQNGSTSESFDFVIVTENSIIGNPQPSPVGNPVGPEVLIRTSALSTPIPNPGTPIAWTFTNEFLTPVDVLPHTDTWYLGVGVSSNPAWSNDGASIQMASYGGLGTPFPNAGDNPFDDGAGGGPTTITYFRDVTNGTYGTAASPRGINVNLLTAAPVFSWGADIVSTAAIGPNPNYGVAGWAPDVSGAGNQSRIAAYGPSAGYVGRAGAAGAFGPGPSGDSPGYKLDAALNIGDPFTFYIGLSDITSFTLPVGRLPSFAGFTNGSLIVPIVVVLPAASTGIGSSGTVEGALFGPTAPGLAPFAALAGGAIGGQWASLITPAAGGPKITFSNAATVLPK